MAGNPTRNLPPGHTNNTHTGMATEAVAEGSAKRIKQNDGVVSDLMQIVGGFAAPTPVSVGIYGNWNDVIHLMTLVTRVRPGYVEARNTAPAPHGLWEPMQLLSMDALEKFVKVTRDGVMPVEVEAIVCRDGRCFPLTLESAEESKLAFQDIGITGNVLVSHGEVATRDDAARRVAEYVWKLLN